MATRGIYGFRYKSVDKLTYNHYDSYPSGLGVKIAEVIINNSYKDLIETFDYITLVHEDSKPTEDQINHCRKYYKKNDFDDENFIKSMSKNLLNYLDMYLDDNDINQWYWLLNKSKGNLNVYITRDCKYMIDNSKMLRENHLVDWAYVINLDTQRLEIYSYCEEIAQLNLNIITLDLIKAFES